MKRFIYLTLFCLVTGFSQLAFAERVDVKGVGTYSYDGKLFSSGNPSDEEKKIALNEAKKNAWKNFVAKQNSSQQQMISKNEKYFLDNLDKFVIDVIVLNVSKDSDLKTLNVVARVGFNDIAVGQYLQQASVGSSASSEKGSESAFTFLFMARKQTSIKQFDSRRTDVKKSTSANTVAADGAVTSESVVQSGGNTSRKEDEVTYAVSSSQDLDAAVGEIVTTAGVEYIGYDDIVANCSAPASKSFQNEYVSADEMSPKTRASVISAVRSCDVKYFATGTVDTGVASIDSVSGNQQVFVSVRAQLWDVSKKLPRKVGSVGPKQFSGLGPDQSIAAKNAIAVAAKDLAQALIDQLNSKGIR
jgi:hypothetical protein